MGFGINYTTGDFSRGAAGIWIRNGELAEPVQEINVSGNLLEMFGRIDAVGNDAQWFGATSAPTLRMSRMTGERGLTQDSAPGSSNTADERTLRSPLACSIQSSRWISRLSSACSIRVIWPPMVNGLPW